jgi:hypothetical protein
MSTFYTSIWMVTDVTILHKWLKGYKCQHYAQVVERLEMPIFNTSG